MIQQRLQEAEEKQSNQSFKSKLDSLKREKVEKATTRVVNFKLQVGCGCGGEYRKYHAEVPIDSHLKDGGYVDDFEDWMSNVQEGWV